MRPFAPLAAALILATPVAAQTAQQTASKIASLTRAARGSPLIVKAQAANDGTTLQAR